MLLRCVTLPAAAAETLSSPDGRIQVTLHLPAPDSEGRLTWSLDFRGQLILSKCGLGLRSAESGDWLEGARVVGEHRRAVDARIEVRYGRADHARDHFREQRIELETTGQRRFTVVFRCYNDAVAVRYELPASESGGSVTLTDEATSFRPVGDPRAFVQYLEGYRTSHEHEVIPTRLSSIRPGVLLEVPLTLSWEDGTYVALTEAALRRYAGMGLTRVDDGQGRVTLISNLTPREDGSKVVGPLPLRTPWRVVLIGDRPGALLESMTIHCLNDPPAGRDFSWVQPGKITFPWWNGDVFDGRRGAPILSLEMATRYIDFCARNGIPYHAMTSTEDTVTPWYQQTKPGVEPGPDTDVTQPRPGFDLEAIRRYAESKGVKLWTWVHQGALRGRVEEAFAAFERMGWSGMMVDFFDHDDQETVEFAEAVLDAAARHRILVHLHGVWKPTGLERTYPNLMNHEGALNLEYLKWSDRCTPEHDLMMAFTRLIAGPMDYHLGGFRAVRRAEFVPRNIAPHVLGTRAHMLAMYVCFDNPSPMVADYPLAYEGEPGFEFILQVPTAWDETRVIQTRIGDLLVMARRRGDTWYLGGLAARQPRSLDVPLSFLGAGTYVADLWTDPPLNGSDPNALRLATRRVTARERLAVGVALDGGFVARLVPDRP